ncbi:MAG: right-handed parallel beta-helix repeat-containing protein [Planctomycetota bacterium]
MNRCLVGLTATLFLALTVRAEEPKLLLINGGFEEVAEAPGVGKDGGKYGSWMLRGSPRVPAQWTLSGHFGGELSVMSEGAPEGKLFLRIQAGAEREAHIHQLCPAIKSGGYYNVSLRYRGGPVLIRAYEYIEEGKSPRIETIATGSATDLNGEWRRIEGLYYPPRTIKVSMVAAAAAGCVADIDDFRAWQDEARTTAAAQGWLNARDYGASGSMFETTAAATADSNEIVVKDVGDFKVNQWVSVSKCNVRYERATLSGPKSPYGSQQPLGNALDMRGYDGSQGSWFVYMLEIESDMPHTFRWSDDLVKGYKWTATKVPITWDWQKLSHGIEVKFNKRDLAPGHLICFHARDQLVTKIERIEGAKLILKDKANRTVTDAVVRHSDTVALQTAINHATGQRKNVFVPNGAYRLTHGMTVRNGDIRIEGESGVNTVMDITEGTGPVFNLYGGTEVTIRNFRMIGHTPMAEMPGSFQTSSGYMYWACAQKSCNAVSMNATERILIENVHAEHMASEAFYCQGPCRVGKAEPAAYTKSLTFLRCSVTDCAANAFNNNDLSENTCVLYCRIDGAGWHAYEGPARFIKLIGNYVRNAGPFTVGDCSSRPEWLHELGCGQAIVADNVFEGCDGRNGGVYLGHGPTQVTIANNLFINYNGPAIRVSSDCCRSGDMAARSSFPTRNVVVKGNIIDLTYPGEKPATRWGIDVSASDVIVADNQVYVRGEADPRAYGIRISEPARNVTVHDNLIRNCTQGVCTTRAASAIRKVIDPVSFLETRLPLEWATSHCYRGWDLMWTSGANKDKVARLDSFDAATTAFKLAKPCDMKVGDQFEIIPPDGANWNIHSNTITGCKQPVILDSYGSNTSFFRDNIVTRGGATGVQQAIHVAGRFNMIGNQVCGFDEDGSAALLLSPDRAGRDYKNLFRENVFQDCANVVKEATEGIWKSSITDGNILIDCGNGEKGAKREK